MDISTTTVQELINLLTSLNVILATGAVWILILMVNRLLPAKIVDHSYYQRIQPVIPEVLGVALTYVPGVMPTAIFNSSLFGHIVFGLWMGFASSKIFKVMSQSVLGHDAMINGKEQANTQTGT